MKALIAVASFALAATTVSAVSNVAQSTLLGVRTELIKRPTYLDAFFCSECGDINMDTIDSSTAQITLYYSFFSTRFADQVTCVELF